MKNLIDDLHDLDNYDYKVSPDFSKKVINKIKKDKKLNTLNYVISFASLGVVACLAFVLITNVNLKNNFNNSINILSLENEEKSTEYADEYDYINSDFNYNFDATDNSDSNFDSNFDSNSDSDSNSKSTSNLNSASALGTASNSAFTSIPEADSDLYGYSLTLENIAKKENAFMNIYVSGDSIIGILEKAKYEVIEVDDSKIKVKAKIQDVENLLNDVKSELTIYEEDDYVIIEIKG